MNAYMKRYELRFDYAERLASVGVLVSEEVQHWIEAILSTNAELAWDHGVLRLDIKDAALLAYEVISRSESRSLNEVEFAVYDCLVTNVFNRFWERGTAGFLAEYRAGLK